MNRLISKNDITRDGLKLATWKYSFLSVDKVVIREAILVRKVHDFSNLPLWRKSYVCGKISVDIRILIVFWRRKQMLLLIEW